MKDIFDSDRLPPEERLVILSVRRRSRAESLEFAALFPRCDSARLQAVANANAVARPVAAAIVNEVGDSLDEHDVWRTVASTNARRLRAMSTALSEIFLECASSSAPVALIEAAGVLYHSNLAFESFGSGDFDILTQHDHLPSVDAIMGNVGFTRVVRAGRVQGHRREYRGESSDGIELWMDVTSLPFERSRVPFLYPDPTARWLRLTCPSRKDPKIRVLSAEHLLAQVAVHTSLHSYVLPPGLRLHIDVDRVVRDNTLDWELFIGEIRRLGFPRRAYYSLWIARELLGTPVPGPVLSALDPGPIRTESLKRVLFGQFVARDAQPSLDLVRRAILEVVLFEGYRPVQSRTRARRAHHGNVS